jgi:hypothetical protein
MPKVTNSAEAIADYKKDFAENREVLSRLGAFIYTSATAENLLHLILRYASGAPDAKARIISKHIRTEVITKKIESLNTLNDMPIEMQERVKLLFSKFNKIYEMRNFIVHRTGSVSGNNLIIGNWLTSEKFDLSGDMNIFKPKHFEDASYDLTNLMYELTLIYFQEQNAGLRREDFASYTWRYTPPELTPELKELLRIHKERHSQSQSSQQ